MSNELTFEETLAVMRGENLEEYRKEASLKAKIRDESEALIDSPINQWPQIKINWDISVESQGFCFDGVSEKDFNENHPEGLLLGYVSLEDFDKKLCHYSRRDEGELWELGCQRKLAYLIVYLSEGRPISPPVVKPVENGEVIFIGGHHRYAVAKAIGENKIPIYVCPENKLGIDKIVNVEWVNT
ncbi:hypothetical protein MNBD_GAMMA13-1653 [hydrothermal vent metagenome]|uniref:ParB/Sulfiredoxin domain-containing protein n=1 Tax=hydrothermal vent metagenome TaxID=652676 RepID=A0A3B0YTS2_9ZZZZ